MGIIGLLFIFALPSYGSSNLVTNGDFEQVSLVHWESAEAIDQGSSLGWSGKSTDIFSSNFIEYGPLPYTPLQGGSTYAGFYPLVRLANDFSDGGYRESLIGALNAKLNPGIVYQVQSAFALRAVDQLGISEVGITFYDGRPENISEPTDLIGFDLNYSGANAVSNAINFVPAGSYINHHYFKNYSKNYTANGQEKFFSIALTNHNSDSNGAVPSSVYQYFIPDHTWVTSAYLYVDNVSVTCSASPKFKINGQNHDNVRIQCGDSILVSEASASYNVYGHQWLLEELDSNLVAIQSYLSTEQIKPSSAQSPFEAFQLKNLFPQVEFTEGKTYRLTMIGFCQNAADSAQSSIVFAIDPHPVNFETLPQSLNSDHLIFETAPNRPATIRFQAVSDFPIDTVEWNFPGTAPVSGNQIQEVRTWIEPTENYPWLIALQIKHKNGCTSKVERELSLAQPDYWFPNAFSPNNDGNNDTFKVFSKDYRLKTIRIFDRWGELVFESSDTNFEWDGNYKGNPAPVGVYVYEAFFQPIWMKESASSSKPVSGQVTVIR